MKIAVSATAPSLDAEVDPRFGRCQYFIIVDPQSMEFEAVDNSNAMASGSAGISTAQMIASKGVEMVLTGNCGPNAYQTLSAAGVQVITGVSGRIKDAVEAFKAGKFQSSTQPSVGNHYGMGMGMERGMVRGMGMGVGPGMMPQTAPPATSPEQEIEMLKSQAQMLGQQLNEIQRRLEELEKGR
ncbi:MAG TPA: NifB/NifX family molybdenum-iron cluster-binding protein [Dehalococcoidia bacterium]|nr:NifB/NifX family molybdenum-iron cluster-binding protein [Dehalococcoidia bacterium]